jgi:drug/metabolite transporter (DMT)-like permease
MTVDWVVVALFGVLCVLGAWRSKQLWRNESPALRTLPEDVGRTLPTSSVLGLLVCVSGAVYAAGDRHHPSVLGWIAAVTLATILIVALPLLHQLRRHGRPQALVPPPLRSRHDGREN